MTLRGSREYPVGAGTYSKHPSRYADGVPHEMIWASGAYVGTGDVSYVDLTSGMGAVILGHGDRGVSDAIANQLSLGIAFPLPTPLETIVARKLLALMTWPKAESVRFGKNGADVTTSAVRLARAVTGRSTIIYVDYHGHHDWCMTDPPMNGGVLPQETMHVGRANVLAALEATRAAAVVIEPYPSGPVPWLTPARYWADLRAACDRAGTLLILDEMVSGFRAAPGGGAEFFGIEPDIACYGKAIANGMPLSAVVGPYDYLRRYEEDVFFSLTHAGEALSLAAASATMDAIADGSVIAEIADLGRAIRSVVGHDRIVSTGYPTRMVFASDQAWVARLCRNGVLCGGYANLTLAHVRDERARGIIMAAFAQS